MSWDLITGKNSIHWVYVTHINNPHDFYVRLTKHWDFIKKIEDTKPVSRPRSVNVKDIVLFNLNTETENPKYVRGRVKHIEEVTKTCTLFAIDYGHEKNVSLNQIWKCDKSFLNMAPLALHCQLKYCEKKGNEWGKAIQAFKDYAGTERAKMFIEDVTPDNQLIVSLYNTLPDDIATMLLLTEFTYYTKHNGATATASFATGGANEVLPTFKELKIAAYNFKKLKIGDILHVRVLSGKSLDAFYVADVNDYREYLDKREHFTRLTKKEPLINETCVKCGDVVCVYDSYDKIFKRGIVTQIFYSAKYEINQARIHMVDLGKEQVTSLKQLRRVPEEYLSLPVVGIFCALTDNQYGTSWEDVCKLLHPGRQHQITVKGTGHQLLSPNIVAIDKIKK